MVAWFDVSFGQQFRHEKLPLPPPDQFFSALAIFLCYAIVSLLPPGFGKYVEMDTWQNVPLYIAQYAYSTVEMTMRLEYPIRNVHSVIRTNPSDCRVTGFCFATFHKWRSFQAINGNHSNYKSHKWKSAQDCTFARVDYISLLLCVSLPISFLAHLTPNDCELQSVIQRVCSFSSHHFDCYLPSVRISTSDR